MARGKQLLELVAQLRAETGRTQDVSIGTDEADNLKVILQRTQETLYDDYEWPHLRVERNIDLAIGQRYYDLPTDLDYERIQQIKLKYNNIYVDITRGISFDDFSNFDSNADERSFPTLKWDIRFTGTTEQLEAWPIPNQAAKLYFFGTKTLGALIQDSDRADLDDRLIVLHAAAEILARQKSKDAPTKAQQAGQRLLMLRRNSQAGSRTIAVGQGNKMRPNNNRTQVIIS